MKKIIIFFKNFITILNIENSDFTKLNKKVDDEMIKFSKIYLNDGQKKFI